MRKSSKTKLHFLSFSPSKTFALSLGDEVLVRTLNLFCQDRKSTRLNSSHLVISYAVFCLKKKNQLLHYINASNTTATHLLIFCYRHQWVSHESRLQWGITSDTRMLPLPPSRACATTLAYV